MMGIGKKDLALEPEEQLQGYFNIRSSKAPLFPLAGRETSIDQSNPGPGAYNMHIVPRTPREGPSFQKSEREELWTHRDPYSTDIVPVSSRSVGRNGTPGPGSYNPDVCLKLLNSHELGPFMGTSKRGRLHSATDAPGAGRYNVQMQSRGVKGGCMSRAKRPELFQSSSASPGPGRYSPLFGVTARN